MIDVRPGEHLRTIFMSLYLMLVLFAYYILKPVSRALFLNKFDVDKLPVLYILIAAAGGLLAYVYTRIAIRSSLQTAVAWAMSFTAGVLVLIYWLIGLNQNWVYYFFNIWVSLISVMLVSQGWLVAANVFTPREARRLYGILGAGAVVGAALGGEFTSLAVRFIKEPRDLLLASAALVGLAYAAFRGVAAQPGVNLARAKGAGSDDADFQFTDILKGIHKQRHLQIIVGIIILTFIVDVTIEYQFNALAKLQFKGHDPTGKGLTAFLGNFYGIYVNLATIVLQIVLTALVVKRLGVGGTLQITPVTIGITSLVTFLLPGVYSTSALRLTEAATRYTLNRTGMELLYLPLPLELKNRTKAFVDIFVDRFGRGIGGMILILVTGVMALKPRQISLVTIAFTIPWILLSIKASREYVATVRKRLSARRLDFESVRVNIAEPGTVRILEAAARSGNARQATYALELLSDAPKYAIGNLLRELAQSPVPAIRQEVYRIARKHAGRISISGFEGQLRKDLTSGDDGLRTAAIGLLITAAADGPDMARSIAEDGDPEAIRAVIAALDRDEEASRKVVSRDWITRMAAESDPRCRAAAAMAIAVLGDGARSPLRMLLADPDADVAREACRTVGLLREATCIYAVLPLLARPDLRGTAVDALAAFGESICGIASSILNDETMPVEVRRRAPRILKLVKTQTSVDTLVAAIAHGDLAIRESVLKALNSLRVTVPGLNFENEFVSGQILNEARYYFELNAALAVLASDRKKPGSAAGLLARTLDERLSQTLERLFRLLGLRYPPSEIHSAYLAVRRRDGEQFSAAIEFLDSVLSSELKKILLPMIDDQDGAIELGRRLFGIEVKTPDTAVGSLIACGDPWLEACAIAAAGELKLSALAPEIASAARGANPEVARVAVAAQIALAA